MMVLKMSDKKLGHRFSKIFGSKVYCRLLIALSKKDAMSADELHKRTQYSIPEIERSLEYLASIGMVDRCGDTYTITSEVLKELMQELQRCLDTE